MDPQSIATYVQTGGLVALAVIMTSLHVYDVRYTLPALQRSFHDELAKERDIWAAELQRVRENTERRQREMILELRDSLKRAERYFAGIRHGKRVEDGGDPDAAA